MARHSEAVDDYLKIIFALTHRGGTAATGEIAHRLGLAPASVTGMVQRLAAQEVPLVRYSKNRGVLLTEAGRLRALEVIRHHRLLETFLHETLGVSWEKVHEEAERLEHHISEELEEAIAEHLGNPELDPHGAPIPHRDGTMPRARRIPLAELEPGRAATVVRVPAGDPELSGYLEGLGLVPGRRVVMESVAPFGGPVWVRAGGGRHALGREVARGLMVLPEPTT